MRKKTAEAMGERTPQKRIVLHGHEPGAESPRERSNDIRPAHVYLLSPANASGERAKLLFRPEAKFELAQRLRATGISIGEAFSFMSSLYFRGKLAYTSVFAKSMNGVPGTLVITASGGLIRPETVVHLEELAELSSEKITAKNPKYRDPLERDLRVLSDAIEQDGRVVLLGSIATKKYVPLLMETLGQRLVVPRAFLGLGNMQRGALLLRCSRQRSELEYVCAAEVLAKLD